MSLFGLSQPAASPAVFGLPAAAPPILPCQPRQGVTGTTGNITLSSLPLSGSILIAHGSSNTGTMTSSGCSGGGVVTWNLIVQHVAIGTNQTAHAVYWGVVGATPATGVTLLINGAVAGVMGQAAEFTNMTGVLAASVDGVRNSSAGSLTLPTLRSGVRRGYVLAAMSGSGMAYPASLTAIISSTTNRNSAILYLPVAYPANTDLSFTMTTTLNITAAAAIIE